MKDCTHSLFIAEEADALMREYKATGDRKLRNQLVLCYTNQVDMAIRSMRSILLSNIPYEDFFNQGVLALMDCIERFDPNRGASFQTYIYRGIRGALLNYMRKQRWLPNRVREARRDIQKAQGELQAKLLREPTHEELANALELTEQKLSQLQMEISSVDTVSLEELMEESFGNVISSTQSCFDDNVAKDLLETELRSILAKAILELTPKQRQVITLCYYENLNLREIGEVLELTQQRVSQIRSAAIEKLRDAMRQYQLVENN